MMDDYISKAQVLEIYAELYDVFDDNPKILEILHTVYEKINGLKKPVYKKCMNTKVDMIEVVRCKDCKYCEYPKSEKEWCKKGHLHGNAETWFCADGERRDKDA